jgi:hypothetical protein
MDSYVYYIKVTPQTAFTHSRESHKDSYELLGFPWHGLDGCRILNRLGGQESDHVSLKECEWLGRGCINNEDRDVSTQT